MLPLPDKFKQSYDGKVGSAYPFVIIGGVTQGIFLAQKIPSIEKSREKIE